MSVGVEAVLGCILAGGAGSRLDGADKGLLPLFDQPLVATVAARLRPQCGRLLVVANRNLADYAHYAPVIHDQDRERAGPLAGLLAAFALLLANPQALPRWLLTVPVDCPDPPRDLTTRLLAALHEQADARCAFAQAGAVAQPLFALYRLADAIAWWQASAQTALAAHASTWRWHAELGAIAVGFNDIDTAFHNLNTRTEFEAYARHHVAR